MSVEGALRHLAIAEKKEFDPWQRDDIRIAWITILEASRGNSQPHIDASYRVLGLHPDKVWPAIVAKRKAQLGREYSLWYDAAGNLRPDAPKKDSARVRQKKTEVA